MVLILQGIALLSSMGDDHTRHYSRISMEQYNGISQGLKTAHLKTCTIISFNSIHVL